VARVGRLPKRTAARHVPEPDRAPHPALDPMKGERQRRDSGRLGDDPARQQSKWPRRQIAAANLGRDLPDAPADLVPCDVAESLATDRPIGEDARATRDEEPDRQQPEQRPQGLGVEPSGDHLAPGPERRPDQQAEEQGDDEAQRQQIDHADVVFGKRDGVPVHNCETPRCGFMPLLGAARAAPL
jgi:hypothetical protein